VLDSEAKVESLSLGWQMACLTHWRSWLCQPYGGRQGALPRLEPKYMKYRLKASTVMAFDLNLYNLQLHNGPSKEAPDNCTKYSSKIRTGHAAAGQAAKLFTDKQTNI
jgi:hypothetical protein